jgi:D-serine deaminase-like pyridoxal phosphate-dependent protein
MSSLCRRRLGGKRGGVVVASVGRGLVVFSSAVGGGDFAGVECLEGHWYNKENEACKDNNLCDVISSWKKLLFLEENNP